MVMRTWWLVDGMNVIGSRPDGGWRDRTRAMRTLVAQLEVMSVRERRDVTVVFDGRPRDLGRPRRRRPLRRPRPRRRRPGGDLALCRSSRPPAAGGVRVVTSDARLARQISALGALAVPSGRFRGELDAQGGHVKRRR